jgi:transcription termination factor Rho
VVGAIRQPRENDNSGRQKYSAIVKIDSINGLPIEAGRRPREFGKPALSHSGRLRLETESRQAHHPHHRPRIADRRKASAVSSVSPPKAGKTLVLQAIANAIAKNSRVHLMVVLVDERRKRSPTCSAR